jgi:hypothetical protein
MIAVAMPYDPPIRVQEFVLRHSVPYPVALDVQGAVTSAFGGVPYVPTAFIIDPNGKTELIYTGRLDIAKVRRIISRYLKNGIESSHDTARILAEAMIRNGISERSLGEHFHRPCLRLFRYDNVWGRLLFGIYEGVLRKGHLSDAYLEVVNREVAGGNMAQAHILWSVVAGDTPYREIARDALALRTLWNLLRALPGGR